MSNPPEQYYKAILHDFQERYPRSEAASPEAQPRKKWYDLKWAFYHLKQKHGGLISDAAAGVITREEAAALLREPLWKVRQSVERANHEARNLLREYYSVLPARLQKKYQYHVRD